MITDAIRTARWRNVAVALILASALGMIAFSVNSDSRRRLAHFPQLVHDTLRKSFSGAI
jgi:hypothetical protein